MLKISLEAARVNAGYTQKAVAEVMKVSNRTIGKWEKGESFPDAQQVAQLCELYRMPYDNINFLPDNSL